MPIGKALSAALCAGSLLVVMSTAVAQESQRAQADNTRVNQRDRAKNEVTADQQKMNKSDRTLTKEIRQAIVEDKSLSTYAHNVKIISQHGQVTLKGPVRSAEEKKTIESKAAQIAGAEKIKNELSIAPGGDASGEKARKQDK